MRSAPTTWGKAQIHLRTHSPSANAFKDCHRLSFFYRMLCGWGCLQQTEGGRYKILKVNTDYHESCLSQKKHRLVPTMKSNASCCILAARTATNDPGAFGSRRTALCRVCYKANTAQTKHQAPNFLLLWKAWNYRHPTIASMTLFSSKRIFYTVLKKCN